MNEQIHEKLKEIKQSFRLLMNGVASHSMRQKGVTYKINWGYQSLICRRWQLNMVRIMSSQ